MLRTLNGFVLALVLCGLLPISQAQDASGERLLRSWIDDVKLDDGSQARWIFAVTYSPETGVYAETVTDENGALIQRTVGSSSMVRPTQEETEIARRVILSDAELSVLFERADNPTLDGGFLLTREEGHPCGPGSRCLQFDMFDVDTAARRVDRIRYVVVDARTYTIVSRDFDPSTDGNATRFNGNPAPKR